jgi:hypothetical protein
VSVLLFTSGGKGNSPRQQENFEGGKGNTQDNKKTWMMGTELELAYF